MPSKFRHAFISYRYKAQLPPSPTLRLLQTSSSKTSCLVIHLSSPFFFNPFCLSNQFYITMENTEGYSPNLVFAFYLVGFVGFPIFQRIQNSAIRILQFYSGFFQSQLDVVVDTDLNVQPKKKSPNPQRLNKQLSFHEKVDDGKLCRGVEMVMEKLGISCDPDGEKLQEKLGLDGLLHLFEEKDPTFEELKEAFEVFDENRDGYIDAGELQRVLFDLGFVEGLELGDCKRMIAAFDTNEDERIDFNEFEKIMENSFC
ncbi:probable calcium-binding protein CML46 [Macadamia integrifolia]|uniref:probable calcium-binding protein CML46 n=1 Tax=Macadamia integrifolia TaxID=60698 RepID=UPI001C4EBD85|nr:probable calcium-binding protein CML46 [Macadamia integrifolia]